MENRKTKNTWLAQLTLLMYLLRLFGGITTTASSTKFLCGFLTKYSQGAHMTLGGAQAVGESLALVKSARMLTRHCNFNSCQKVAVVHHSYLNLIGSYNSQ